MSRASTRRKTAVNYNEDRDVAPKPKPATKAAPNGTSNKGAAPKSKPTTQKRKAEAEAGSEAEAATKAEAKEPPKKPPGKKAAVKVDAEDKVKEEAPAAKKRKTKAKAGKDEDEDKMPLAERTAVGALKKAMYIGAHVSAAGGVQNSIANAVHIGANSFALFLKSQRKWANPPLAPDARDGFLSACQHHGYAAAQHALPHGSYLVNLAQGDAAKADQAYAAFVDDLRRCEQLGIRLYNFHPGSTGGDAMAAATGRIAAQINRAHADTPGSAVVAVLENMAGSGNVVGGAWEDLRDIIALVDDKERVGVCIDTCHAFAAGYDLRSPEAFAATMDSFDKIVGLKYLKGLHINDSKTPLSSNRDLHANIGTGFLGLRAFHNVMNYDPFAGKPMVLETPIDKPGADGKSVEDKDVHDAREIKLLESLVGMDPLGDEFRRLEADLHEQGAAEREKAQAQVDKKGAKGGKGGKANNGASKGKAPAKRKKKQADSDDSDD